MNKITLYVHRNIKREKEKMFYVYIYIYVCIKRQGTRGEEIIMFTTQLWKIFYTPVWVEICRVKQKKSERKSSQQCTNKM